jgi:hypothetical protein
MATEKFSETLENPQHLTRPTPEIQSHTLSSNRKKPQVKEYF